ncbi:MAG TPA: antibiotic biosynthesis monooxygenase [Sphingobacteriaceae bacterium]|nr:antibiotic biosynthesis monooxygenase [Sphingobacteriaceae bacterium]
MIIRIVKMIFQKNTGDLFEEIFHITQPDILKFEGCFEVKLHRDTTNPSIYFTVSRWESANELEKYRSSDFFKATWAKVKPMFIEKAEAWSLEILADEK